MVTWTVELVVPEGMDLDAAGETVTLEVDEDETVLAAARRNGVWLPADCQQGWCTTCAAKLLDGEIDQSLARRYYEEDVTADFVLPCTLKPRSDLRLRVGVLQEMLEHRADHDLPPGRSKLDS